MAKTQIRVAVIGGGLGGTVLMNALTRYPQLDVHLYEANPEFKERGASVGLANNAKRALQLLGLGDVIKKAKGVRTASFRLVVGEGPDAGKNVMDLDEGLETVHRAALLRELLAPIPKDKLHLGKRLSSISDTTIHFQDGSSTTADVIIGSDGIHSSVRKYILGEGHPAVDPVFAGFWDCRCVIPFDEALAKIGPTRIDKQNPRQHLYCGKDSLLFHDTIDDGESICVIGGGPTPEDWDKNQWKRSVSREWLNEVFKNWGDAGQNMLDCLCGDQTELSTFVQWASAEAPKLYNGGICMIGDAAHATTPWQGSGLALAIEDSLVLQNVLGRCHSVNEVPSALEAYDRIMRPRGQHIIESSRETGLIFTGKNGIAAEQLERDLRYRWEFIVKWDTEGAVKEAVDIFEQLTGATSNGTTNGV